MGRSGKMLRSLLGVILLTGFIWLLSVELIVNQATKTSLAIKHSSAGSTKHLRLTRRHKHGAYQDSDLTFVSKRRVPNGPDPIHNRRSRSSRQPPNRA